MNDHPDDQALRRWLETGKPTGVARHLDEGCEGCLDRLDVLSDLGEIRATLERASAPPQDLHRRTTGMVQGRLAADEAVLAFLDLFTLPARTASVLFGETTRRGVDGLPTTEQDSDDDGERAHD